MGQECPDDAAAKKTRYKVRIAACRQCPDRNWRENVVACVLFTTRPCYMQGLLKAKPDERAFLCKHWPE